MKTNQYTHVTVTFTMMLFGMMMVSPLQAATTAAPEKDRTSPQIPTEASKTEVDKKKVQATLSQLPLYFIENRGQISDKSVSYYLKGQGTTVYFTPDGVTFALTEAQKAPITSPLTEEGTHTLPFSLKGGDEDVGANGRSPELDRWAVRLEFVGAKKVTPRAEEATPAKISYFKGSKDQWKTGLKTYSKVVYPNLWPGIDMIYYGKGGQLEYDVVVHPGADPSQVRLAYRGAESVQLTKEGMLNVVTPVRTFGEGKPYVYQEVNGKRVEVASSYRLEPHSSITSNPSPPNLPLKGRDKEGLSFSNAPIGNPESNSSSPPPPSWGRTEVRGNDPEVVTYGFELGAYDKTKALVLDPPVFVYVGYIGGSGEDLSSDIAVDGTGAAYVTGTTHSTEATFPVLLGPDTTLSSASDAFVVKVMPNGSGLSYAGYIGGSAEDRGTGIVVDGAGAAYVVGDTFSDETTFPVLLGPDITHNGARDTFLAKVMPDGSGLSYAGYIGGSGTDFGRNIAVDGVGAAYVIGETSSTAVTFPVLLGPDITHNGGFYDVFVVKVMPGGTGFSYAGYIGGNGPDYGGGIVVDGTGAAYVTGTTRSNEITFPVLVGPDLTYNGGTYGDAFLAKVLPGGVGLSYAGYIGGSASDYGIDIAVDTAGSNSDFFSSGHLLTMALILP